jgi:diguanylate cyclase (GGDEF)-like protein
VHTGSQARSEQQVASTVDAILALTVGHAVKGHQATGGGPLPAGTAQSLHESVDALRAAGTPIGLEVWGADGALLWADVGHPVAEARLPEAELTRVRRDGGFTQRSDGDGRGGATLEVFRLYDRADDAGGDLVAEVVLPAQTEPDVSGWVHRLYVALGAVALLVMWFGLSLRRRLVRREYEAMHDSLTGLGNRAALAAAGVRLRRSDSAGSCLILLDLDGFKEVNDTLGHHAGDDVLMQVGQVLAARVRPGDTIVRLGGDEFALLMPGVATADAARDAATRVLETLSARQWTADGVAVNVQASAGVALFPAHAADMAALLQRADVAMYQAKRARAGVMVYDPSTDPHDVRQLNLLTELRTAIDSEQLVLHYQPKGDLESGQVHGVEALVRWQHPERGLLPPGVFLPLAEHTALMGPLTRWVLDRACAQAAAWARAGSPLAVAVNISPRLLLDGDLPQLVAGLLAAHGLPASSLELEITETAVMTDPDRARLVLERLAVLGVHVSMDDFGAGYTSMALLKELPVHSLKIDQGFVTHMLTDAKGSALAETVIELGHRLQMQVIAEGVESEQVWERLRDLGCDQAQGFFLARPMPADDIEGWLLARAPVAAVAD